MNTHDRAVLIQLGVVLIYAGVVLAAWALCRWKAERVRMRAIVFHNLDSARDSGYFNPGEYLHGLCAEDIAEDMLVYAPDVEDYEAHQLVPYVAQWLWERNDTTTAYEKGR